MYPWSFEHGRLNTNYTSRPQQSRLPPQNNGYTERPPQNNGNTERPPQNNGYTEAPPVATPHSTPQPQDWRTNDQNGEDRSGNFDLLDFQSLPESYKTAFMSVEELLKNKGR